MSGPEEPPVAFPEPGRVYHEYVVTNAKAERRLAELTGGGWTIVDTAIVASASIIHSDGVVTTGPGVRISYKKDQP